MRTKANVLLHLPKRPLLLYLIIFINYYHHFEEQIIVIKSTPHMIYWSRLEVVMIFRYICNEIQFNGIRKLKHDNLIKQFGYISMWKTFFFFFLGLRKLHFYQSRPCHIVKTIYELDKVTFYLNIVSIKFQWENILQINAFQVCKLWKGGKVTFIFLRQWFHKFSKSKLISICSSFVSNCVSNWKGASESYLP